MEIPYELAEELITGGDCHCYKNGRHWDDKHYIHCAWGRFQKLVDEEKQLQQIVKVPKDA